MIRRITYAVVSILISLFARLLASGWRRICAYTKVTLSEARDPAAL